MPNANRASLGVGGVSLAIRSVRVHQRPRERLRRVFRGVVDDPRSPWIPAVFVGRERVGPHPLASERVLIIARPDAIDYAE